MKKVLISTLNSKYVHTSLAPWCLKAGVVAYCPYPVTVSVIEGTINQGVEEVFQSLSTELSQKELLCVGFSCYIWNIEQTKHLARLLKKAYPSLPILLGGPEVSYHPEVILESCDFVDFVLGGEGEVPFAQLVTLLWEERKDFSSVLGLSYREQGGAFRISPPYVSEALPPSPYCEAYFAQLQGKISYFESSRGCPYHCAFCLSGREEKPRYFPMARVEKDLLQLAQSGTQTIKFVDRTFNSNRLHCDQILSFLLSEYGRGIPETITFHFEMAGDILAESTLELLSQMPPYYVQLEIGMQSFCEKTLEAVGRKTNIPRLLANLTRLVSFGNHHLHIDLIAGLPYEGMAEFEQSFNIAYGIGAEMLQLGFLKVLAGSEIGENPQKYLEDYEKKAPYQVISTPWLSQEDFERLDKIEGVLDRLSNSGRYPRTLSYLLAVTGGNAFALFRYLGEALGEVPACSSLEAYTDAFYEVAKQLPQVVEMKLRDALVLDRVSQNSTGILPSSLKVRDENLRKLTIALEQNPKTARPPHGKRFVGILYSENKGIYVDYPQHSGKKSRHQQRVYPVHTVFLEEFLKKKE